MHGDRQARFKANGFLTQSSRKRLSRDANYLFGASVKDKTVWKGENVWGELSTKLREEN